MVATVPAAVGGLGESESRRIGKPESRRIGESAIGYASRFMFEAQP
jgi:hypothetical protein